jgi:hypothetical protein
MYGLRPATAGRMITTGDGPPAVLLNTLPAEPPCKEVVVELKIDSLAMKVDAGSGLSCEPAVN